MTKSQVGGVPRDQSLLLLLLLLTSYSIPESVISTACCGVVGGHVTHPKSSSTDLKKNFRFGLFRTRLKSARVTRCAGTLIRIR